MTIQPHSANFVSSRIGRIAGRDGAISSGTYLFRWLTTAKPGRLTRYTQSRPGLPGHEGTIRRGFNWSGTRCRWFVSTAPLKPRKQSGGRFSQSFQAVLSLLVHMMSNNGRIVKSAVKERPEQVNE